MSEQIKTETIEAEVPATLESRPGPCDDRAKPHENAGEAEAPQRPCIEVIAMAYNQHGQQPRCVVDFPHGSGYRARRLVETRAFTSVKRARDALAKAGVPLAIVPDDSTLTAIVNATPPATGMYNVQRGWSRGCDVGLIYRHGNTAYTSSGPIAVFADGPVPEPQRGSDTGKLLAALAEDHSPGTFILMAAHCASPLVNLLDCAPIVMIASGVSASEVERLTMLAKSAFGTKPAAQHARRKDTDDTPIQLVNVKSRKEAFAYARVQLETHTTDGNRGNSIGRAHAPVTLILTTEADAPGQLASPMPPSGCIEIHLDASSPDAANTPTQASPDLTAYRDAGAAEAYIEALLRKQESAARYADTNLPRYVERYLAMAKSLLNDGAYLAAAHSFALLRYALTCGYNFDIIPWSTETAHEVMDACVKRLADHCSKREAAFERHVFDAVKKLANPGSSNQRAKFDDREVRFKTINGNELMLIDCGTFDASVVGHLDKARVLDALRKRRLLVTNGDGAQYQARVNGDRTRFYAVDAAVLRAL
ncbi:hypothetical protein [Paraburkholderia nemoris]|uniref:Uncharacterized protein n=1 Tax=Paraburkholderia nemoris TaxID=2793076 RepID=A0ABN7M8P5_9BURK|nr:MULTISPECIES: hypothetical protein [Paraburkholderia]MBK3812593.1 hypothetical protein [Paraburkholderia aspalathi]CAE6706302.1 hypothetical protein R75777_00920 [Paraburkholderia nemoris]CAE6785869.1 hypothetical protein R69776_04539 [Paraburkholderia nemoris]